MFDTVNGPPRPTEPRIDRAVTLQMQGDWGAMNLHRVCGWLSMELTRRCGAGTRMAIWNGRGGTDAARAVGRGEVDLAVITPAAFARAAVDGLGVHGGPGYPDLRALGVVPQDDRLVVAVDRALDVRSFDQLRALRPALDLATSFDDGVNHIGWAATEILDRSEVAIEDWGGRILRDETPFETLARVRSGEATAVIHEAIMLPEWQDLAAGLHFLPVEPAVLAGLDADLGWPRGMVAADYFPGVPAFSTLDFSDFLVLTRADLPDDLAYAIAWVLGETRQVIERQYSHLPPERSPVTYPLDPARMGLAPIALHPGAAAYYDAVHAS